jgi:hypothetical protein
LTLPIRFLISFRLGTRQPSLGTNFLPNFFSALSSFFLSSSDRLPLVADLLQELRVLGVEVAEQLRLVLGERALSGACPRSRWCPRR